MGDPDVRTEDGSATHPVSFDPGSAVLLVAPAMESAGHQLCSSLVGGSSAARQSALVVTYTRSPDDVLTDWRGQVSGGMPSHLAVVSVGDMNRSASAMGGTPDAASPISVATVSSPGDLTGLGITVTEYLRQWNGAGNQIIVCFDSLSMLLQYAELERAFRFIHALIGRFRAIDAVAHCHMDPGVHDERERDTLTTLFDATIEIDDEGAWRVNRR